jgi:hypothetical protein
VRSVTRLENFLSDSIHDKEGNVSGANQPLCATVQTFNLNHMMLIQRDVWGSGRGDLKRCD